MYNNNRGVEIKLGRIKYKANGKALSRSDRDFLREERREADIRDDLNSLDRARAATKKRKHEIEMEKLKSERGRKADDRHYDLVKNGILFYKDGKVNTSHTAIDTQRKRVYLEDRISREIEQKFKKEAKRKGLDIRGLSTGYMYTELFDLKKKIEFDVKNKYYKKYKKILRKNKKNN